MADKFVGSPASGAKRRLRDMGDGTYAEVVALAADPTIDIGDVEIKAGTARIGKVGADADIVGGNFTRPSDTTAYASGDLVANSTAAGSVVPIPITIALANDGKVAISKVRLKKSGTSITNASFRVHLYKTSPTCSAAVANNKPAG